MSGMLADRSCAGGLAPAGRKAFGGDERPEEVEGAALDPRLEPPGPEAFDEADVAAPGQEFGSHRRRQRGRIGECFGRNDPIVERVDEQGRSTNARKVRTARRPGPVVALVGEAV